MRKFEAIARVVQKHRLLIDISQEEFSKKLGYKNGQFVSNIERALCSVPSKKLALLADLLKLDPEVIIEAIIADKYTELRGAVVQVQLAKAEPDIFEKFRQPEPMRMQ